MDRQRLERITSPAVALLAFASIVLIAVDPDRALIWISPAPLLAAIGCLLGARLSLQYRASGAAFVFAAEAIFWLGAAGYLVWLAAS